MTSLLEENYAAPFAHGMGLISDELYKVLTIISSAPVILLMSKMLLKWSFEIYKILTYMSY